ncbi:MAG: FHA domain-containing protein [Gemmataceae bacterium]
MGTRLSLTATGGLWRGREFVLIGPTRCSLGRSIESTFCLPGTDRAASRRHCLLEVGSGGVRVRDLHSLNGTYVNGRPVGDGCPLASGDELRVGGSVFEIAVTAESAGGCAG